MPPAAAGAPAPLAKGKDYIFSKKKRRVDVCETMISDYQDVMQRIFNDDETWIFSYNLETDDQ